MSDKPRTPPAPGESVTYMGRKLSITELGQVKSERKGRDPVIHPNWSRALDAINFSCGL